MIGETEQNPKNTAPILTDTQIRQAKKTGKAYRLYYERGLYLEVSPPGGKLWRFKYYFDGKEKRIGFGKYPEISLSQARERREEARKLVSAGIDPSVERQTQKVATQLAVISGFELIAREWFNKNLPTWSIRHLSGNYVASLIKGVAFILPSNIMDSGFSDTYAKRSDSV